MSGSRDLGVSITAFVPRRKRRKAVARFPGILLLAAAANTVRAADLPSKIEPAHYQPLPAEFSWTGFYAGINVGGGIDHFGFKNSFQTPLPFGYTQGSTGITALGPLGALQIGVNYQLSFFHIVAGLEIDNSAAGISGKTTVNGTFPSGAPFSATFGSRVDDIGTARLRLGYAWGRLLPYFTAGFTYGLIETSYTFVSPGFFNSAASTAVRSGVFPHVGSLGVGAEYAIDSHFTVKAEYLYEFINARRAYFSPGDGTTVTFGTRNMYHLGRIGLNYKFDWLSPAPPPVTAKY